jgi:N-acetylglucosamine malate deacetylase 1
MSTRNVLVIAAHPDDEVLGCGGTLAKLAARGCSVNIAFLADGVTSRLARPEEHARDLAARRLAAHEAAAVLGAKVIGFGEMPDNRLDTVALLDIVRAVEGLIAQVIPDTVFTHFCADLNVDHRRVCEAVVTACRPQRGHPVRRLLCFEVPSSTEWALAGSAPAFAPNWFEDITATLETKLAALACYHAELREASHPRSRAAVATLARWRGATCGTEAAEAFVLGRELA